MSSIIAFIPVRGGSKSIPLKNIKDFCGKPLVYWTVNAAQSVEAIDKVIVATDCDHIESSVNSFNLSKVNVYRRNPDNALDNSSTESVMLEYINQANLSHDTKFILIQATSPLLTSIDLVNGIEKSQLNDSVLSCVKTKRFFWSLQGKAINYNYNERPRRQDFDGLFMENGAFYISKVESILKSKNRISGHIIISEMPEYTGVEIDEEEDWIIAESLMNRFVLKNGDGTDKKIKLFVTDVDGVMTDAGMYYSENGDELKKFNTHDGMAFQLLRENGIKTAIITSENTNIVKNRAKKLKVDYLFQGKGFGGKLEAVKEICLKENVNLSEVAYIGDDLNCKELLSSVGLAACPSNAVETIKKIRGIICLSTKGGEGVVREFVEKEILVRNSTNDS